MTLETMRWHEAATIRYASSDYRRAGVEGLVEPLVVGRRVLDMRAMGGTLAVALAQRGFDVSALAAYDESVRLTNALARVRGIPGEVARPWSLKGLSELFSESEFDTVLALDILNHVEDDDRTMEEISRITKVGGRLIVLAPAFKSMLCARDRYFGHLRRYDRQDLVHLLQHHGFRVESIRYWNFLPLMPYLLIERGFRGRVSDALRYREPTGPGSLVNRVLRWWYLKVENKAPFPCGLSLFAVAAKESQGSR